MEQWFLFDLGTVWLRLQQGIHLDGEDGLLVFFVQILQVIGQALCLFQNLISLPGPHVVHWYYFRFVV